MEKVMQLVVLTLAMAASYGLGSMRAPARAEEDSSKIVGLLRDVVRAEAAQADALKTIARNSDKCAR